MSSSRTNPVVSFLSRYPASVCGAIGLILLTLVFWIVGALSPEEIPSYATSRREIIGMTLMLIGLPPYFLVSAIVVRRHSLGLLETLRSQVAHPASIEEAQESLRHGWKKVWLPGSALGIMLGSLNTSIPEALAANVAQVIHMSLTLGQLFMWLAIGVFFAERMSAARAFRRLSELVELDLFALERLHPLARFGLANVMVIAGALAFTPLQSLDAGFRWYNYQFGLGVAVLASTILLLWPLRPIHRRIREAKAKQLQEVDELIKSAERQTSVENLERLELLLSHRDRLRDLRTWLLSTNLISRFFLYLIIPPLAWVGAAIVERFVDELLSG